MFMTTLLRTIRMSVGLRSKTNESLSKRARVRHNEGFLTHSHDGNLPEYRDS